MRTDNTYLFDTLTAGRNIAQFIEGMTLDEFLSDQKTKSAVMREMAVLGEAANRTSNAGKANHPATPWGELAHRRNFYIHAYYRVDYHRVWNEITAVTPELVRPLDGILADPPE